MITSEEIKTLAKLCKLEFDDERIEEFRSGFEEIIGFANTINSSVAGDTSDIREVGGREIALKDLRCDEVEDSLSAEKVTSNVEAEGGYFPVRRVVK